MAEHKGILKYLGLGNLLESTKGLIDTRVKLIKVELKDELAKALSNIFIAALLLSFLFLAILLLSLGLGMFLGNIWNNYFYGFAVVSGFYVLLFVILFLIKDKIRLRERIEHELNNVFHINK